MEKDILNLFLYSEKLKFNEMEKSLNERSNKLAYHLKNLVNKRIVSKKGDYYKLSRENLIPYLSLKKHILPVILVYIGNEKECFLIERKKKPFKGLLGFPGGRMLLKENIGDSVKRIMKEKNNIDVSLKKIHSVSIEHIKNSKEIIQSDLLIFVTAATRDRIKLTNTKKNKSRIISSDYKLLKRHLTKNIKIERFLTPSVS